MRTRFVKLRAPLLLALGLPVGCSPTAPGVTEAGSSSEESTSVGHSTTHDGHGTMDAGGTSTSAGPATTDATTDPSTSTGDDSATAASGSDSSEGSGSSTGAPTPVECVDPVPIMQLGTDVPSGFVECEGGLIHRAEAVACVEPDSPGSCEWEFDQECLSDDECVDEPFGRCDSNPYDFNACECRYGCETDADCGKNAICVCAGVFGEQSTCISDYCNGSEGCAEDELCALSEWPDVCANSYDVACLGPDAACQTDSDCGAMECPFNEEWFGSGHCTGWKGEWECVPDPMECGHFCGRPLFIEGQPALADARERGDWQIGPSARETPEDARGLAEHWTEQALFEHASVASFARFALELLQLGAPAQLVAETRRAMADELHHARLCFALASRYAGRSLGPDALPVLGALTESADPMTIARRLILEACVAETIAAAEAHEAAAHALDAQVVRALERIAVDELRHAALGWRALRWLLDEGGAPTLPRYALETLRAAINSARDERAAADDEGRAAERLAHGVLPASLRVAVRRRALAELVEPCARALEELCAGQPRRGPADHSARSGSQTCAALG